MRVLLVGNFLSASHGTRGVCEELAERLPEVGLQVLCASSAPRRVPRLLEMVGTAWRRRGDYAVAHVDVFSGPAFLWAEATCWTLRRAGRPYLLTLHGGNLPRMARRWGRRLRALLASAHSVTTPSPYLRRELSPWRADLRLLPNPLDVTRYPLRTGPLAPHLVWLRAFHRVYRPELAVRVLARLRAEWPGARLSCIGPDKGDGSLARTRALARELGVADALELRGPVPKQQVPAELARGALFLNTAQVDNAPVSVLEALACGLPVVSTRVGGIPDLLDHEQDALLVPPDDATAMSAAVARLLRDPALAERLRAAGRRRVEAHDWTRVLPRWEQLFRAAAKQG